MDAMSDPDAMSGLGTLSVIFYLDGPLVDSEPSYYEASRQTLADHGVPVHTWADHDDHVGVSTRESAAIRRERYGLRAPVDDLLARANQRCPVPGPRRHARVPGDARTRRILAAETAPMAVASGCSPEATEAVLAGTGLDAFLRTAVPADEVPRGKPAPDIVLEAARRLDAEPADCVWLEDTAPGVRPPPTRPGCAASPFRTSVTGRTPPSSPRRPCSYGAADGSSRHVRCTRDRGRRRAEPVLRTGAGPGPARRASPCGVGRGCIA
ncbi:HAD family hydrolase [Streptomyces sp. NPDC058294]|uniref:HAD family hydrolase n=1 Tax=Streptomyces sp. NPDC058294 TaxID=3346430 RepID=UPI0036E5AB6B